ncbi:MAG TPA: DUF58 domain-containing protein [Verrucomicrobiales bacterium]|nr:DUF58 domain-containing protein [Verrucomicrobiales bacterium]HIL68371.1 DUF58 domain-containing protein [Verrucomicrobiota bacterium]
MPLDSQKTDQEDRLLNPELLRWLEQFQLMARRRSKSQSRGERLSRSKGHSVEFADYRNYTPGEDLRYLDWNLYGRLDRLFLRTYEEERELPVTVFLDASESMKFGDPSKFTMARKIAASMGYIALCGFDRVRVNVLQEANLSRALVEKLRRVRGKKSALSFFHNLRQLKAGGPCNLNESLVRSSLEIRKPGFAVVLSDFLDPEGYEKGLKTLVGRGFQVNAIQILAPEEINPFTYGDLRLVDSESGHVQEVTFGKYRLKAYQNTVHRFRKRLDEYCRSLGIQFFSTQSDLPVEDFLLNQLRQRSVLG